MIWNDPRFDSFAWSNNVSFGWNRWGWGASFGWGNSWGWDPYWNNYYSYGYNPWGWGHGFYDPWGWNPYWNHYYGYYPHWGHRPGHGHHGPNWGNHRPDWGGASKPTVTTRYAPKSNTRRIETPGHIVPIQELQEVPLYNPGQTAAATNQAQTTIHRITTPAIHQEVILEGTADLARMEIVQRHAPAVEVADLFNVQIRVVEDKSN